MWESIRRTSYQPRHGCLAGARSAWLGVPTVFRWRNGWWRTRAWAAARSKSIVSIITFGKYMSISKPCNYSAQRTIQINSKYHFFSVSSTICLAPKSSSLSLWCEKCEKMTWAFDVDGQTALFAPLRQFMDAEVKVGMGIVVLLLLICLDKEICISHSAYTQRQLG